MRLTLTIFLLSVLTGCDLLSSGDDAHFEIKTLENPDQSEWQTGNYRISEEYGKQISSLEEVERLLDSLLDEDVLLEVAWYRKGSRTCGALGVVVPSQLVVRIDGIVQPAQFARLFEPVDGKAKIFCPNIIQEIRPLRR